MFKVFEEIMENFDEFSNLKLNQPGYAPWIKNGNTYATVVKTIGINPEDMHVALENNVIRVEGSTKFNGMTYSVDFDIPLSDTFLAKVCEVKSETANGLTYITVDLKDKN